MPRPAKEQGPPCGRCRDGLGFFARACPGCSNQKPLDVKRAVIYADLGFEVQVGECVDLTPAPKPETVRASAEDIRDLIDEIGLTGRRWTQDKRGRVYG